MASQVFRDTLIKELGNKYKGRLSGQQLEILEKAELKALELEGTIRIRSNKRGEDLSLSENEQQDFEEAADALVTDILRRMANEDIEELTNQETKRVNRKSTISVSGGTLLRDKKGRFISPVSLERLLNLTLFLYAKKHMGVDGQLKNQTGRLANSGIVTGISTDTATRTASFYFTYMLYPYEVFENRPERFTGGMNYSPVRLFKDAIDSALQDLLSKNSYNTVAKQILFRGDRS